MIVKPYLAKQRTRHALQQEGTPRSRPGLGLGLGLGLGVGLGLGLGLEGLAWSREDTPRSEETG
jgi:hypothetical protein